MYVAVCVYVCEHLYFRTLSVLLWHFWNASRQWGFYVAVFQVSLPVFWVFAINAHDAVIEEAQTQLLNNFNHKVNVK